MDPRIHRTKFAARAATLAERFGSVMEDTPVGAHLGEMTAPEGTTGGGVQTLQHIRLVPPPGKGRTYVVGNANRNAAVAELRSLEYVDRVSVERFGERTGFDPAAYAEFTRAAARFLQTSGLTVMQVSAPVAAPPVATTSSAPSRAALVAWSVFVFAMGIAVGVLATRLGWAR